MEITQMLTISTMHITKETANSLDADCEALDSCTPIFDWGLSVYKKCEYGWFIWIEAACLKNIPDDLAQCIKAASDVGCDWLCLDADGLIEESLKIYEWED